MKITLKGLCELLNANMPKHLHANVEVCWIDYGAGISDTTIVIYDTVEPRPWGGYQALCPREIEEFKNNEFTLDMAIAFVNKINERGW